MARSIDDFVGTYTIRHGQGSLTTATGAPLIQAGYLLCIGTGTYGDPPSDGIKVGLAIFDPNTRQRILPAEGNPPAYGYFSEGTLNGSTYWLENQALPQPMSFQVALMTMTVANGGLYKAPSIMVVIGDPENAGVWGADDQGDG